MIKKHRNTFEGGIDQDTAKKLVKPNTLYSGSNITISNDGTIGEISNFKGFKEIKNSSDNSVNLNDKDKDLHIITLTSTITASSVLFKDNGVNVINVKTITTIIDLYNELLSSYDVYLSNNRIFLYSNSLTAFNIKLKNTKIISTSTFTNLGVKEIILTGNRKLIFLFRKGNNGALYLQIIVYYDLENTSTTSIIGTDIIYKNLSSSTNIDSDNIIYNKETNVNHSLYWCDGKNEDKVIRFSVSIDPNDYSNFTDYINALRSDIFEQSTNELNQKELYFFSRPELYDLTLNDNSGKIKPGEALVFFYKLKSNSYTSNISLYSQTVNIPTDSLEKTDDARTKARYTLGEHRWIAKFSIPKIPFMYSIIESYVFHYNNEGTRKLRKLQDISVSENNIISYNEDYEKSDLEEVELSSLFNLSSTEDISKEQIVYKNRLIKANLKDSLLEAFESYDTRAYRFKSVSDVVVADRRKAKLFNRNNELEYTLIGATPDYDSIDEKADVINKYNDEYSNFSDWNTNQQYKYQSDGTTLGGSGKNISYSILNFRSNGGDDISNRSKIVQEEFNSIYTLNPSELNKIRQTNLFTNPIVSLTGEPIFNGPITPYHETIKGFMGGEVYRFYIILWKSDQPTVSKWIGDIKFPDNNKIIGIQEFMLAEGTPVETRLQTIEFTINTEPFINKASAISIGYVKIEEKDKTVFGTLPTIGFNYLVDGGHFSQTVASGYTITNLQTQETIFMDYANITSDYLSTIDTSSYSVDLKERYKRVSERIKVFPINLKEYGIDTIFNDVIGESLYLKKISTLEPTYEVTSKDMYTVNTNNYNPLGESLKPLNYSVPVTPELKRVDYIGTLDDRAEFKEKLGYSSGDIYASPQPRLKNINTDTKNLGAPIKIVTILGAASGTAVKLTIRGNITTTIILLKYLDGVKINISSDTTGVMYPVLSGEYTVKNPGSIFYTTSPIPGYPPEPNITFDLYKSDGTTKVESSTGNVTGGVYSRLVNSENIFDNLDILGDNPTSNTTPFSYKSDKSFLILEEGFTTLEANKNTLVSFRRNLSPKSQYGGNTYEARQQNEVQIMSYTSIINKPTSVLVRPTGNCYVNYLDVMMDYSSRNFFGYNTSDVSKNGNITIAESRGILFPIESYNNLYGVGSNNEKIIRSRWRDFPTFNNQSPISIEGFYDGTDLITEIQNNVDIYDPNTTTKLTTSVFQSRIQSESPTKIIASEKKFNNEASDSWQIFLINNSRTLDPVWNEINKLVDLKDYLYVFQRDAIANQFVDRVAQSVDDVSQVVLGTGKVLGEHVYVIKNAGITANNHALQTSDDILFKDMIRKKFYSIKNGIVRGLNSLFKNDDLIDFNSYHDFRKIIYDRESEMVFIPNMNELSTSGNTGYISYDNKFKIFTSDSSLDYAAANFFNGSTNLLNIGNVFKIFNKSTFNDPVINTPSDNIIFSFIVNPESENVKTFDNLFINFESKKLSSDKLVDDFSYKPDSITVETEYQTTNAVSTTTTNMRRLGRYWRFTIPKDTNGNRIRDYWAKVTISFPYATPLNNTVNLKEVITSYRLSNLT